MKTLILFSLLLFFCLNSFAQTNVQQKSNQNIISLNKFKGSILVLYFLGDDIDKWNKPIVELNRLKNEFANKNVHIGAVTPKSKNEIEKITKSIDFIMFANKIDFAVVTDSDTAKKYDVKPPYVYVIAQDGKIFWKSKSLDNISSKIQELLDDKNIKLSGTNVYKNAKIDGKAVRVKNTTPKLDYDDSKGIPTHGLTLGKISTPKTSKEKRNRIKGQTIRQYEATEGIINPRPPVRKTRDRLINND